MRIATAADELTGVAGEIGTELARRGHEVTPHGALSSAEDERDAWDDDRANVEHIGEIERG